MTDLSLLILRRDLAQFDGCFVKINQFEYELAETLIEELVTYGSKKVQYKNRLYIPPK